MCRAVLKPRIGITPKPEYDPLERAAKDARLKSEQARIADERYVTDLRK